MNLKKITKVLSKIRKNTREHGDITPEDEDILRELLGTELSGFFEGQNDNAPTNPMPALKQAETTIVN